MTMRTPPVDSKQRTGADWERIIRRGSPTRCKDLIIKALNQSFIGKVALSTSQLNLLEAAANTGDL